LRARRTGRANRQESQENINGGYMNSLFGAVERITQMDEFLGQVDKAKADLAKQVMQTARWEHKQGDLCAFRLCGTATIKLNGTERTVDTLLRIGLIGGLNGFQAMLYADGQLILESVDRRLDKLPKTIDQRGQLAREFHEQAQKIFGVDLIDFYRKIYPVNIYKKKARVAMWVTIIVLGIAFAALIVVMSLARG
jgi:hypothetical protein